MPRLVILILLALSLSSCARATPAAPASQGGLSLATQSEMLTTGTQRPADGSSAPDFSYTMADGTRHKLSDLRGTPVILNFWATWCGPCRTEMATFEQAAQTYRDDLVILAVNRNEAPSVISAFGNELGLTFPLIANMSGDIGDRYGATSLPMTFFINRDGTIQRRHVGIISAVQLEEYLAELE
ncbi:TlpA family protein disulfide reductase [Candidatus Oscillochloris fontis]|uniref:TlpA family protein disulfide reductase n=1 Tax=Candidatus Oscillochloris fontis TaxID=2496868 RepID=UPI00101CDFA6|nr:TlpA disulfide reductase family protein [Candidatus Oscillochloris fontis]